MSFTRAQTKFVVEEIQKILDASALPYEFDHGRVTFGQEINFKLTIRQKGAQTKEQRDLLVQAAYDNIDVNKTGPKGEKLVAYKARRPKYPYLYETKRGALYKCSTLTARRMFGK